MRTVWIIVASSILVALMFSLVLWQWSRLMADPEVAFLPDHPRAKWIRMPQDEGPGTYGKKDFMAAFRKSFTIAEMPERAVIVVYGFRYVEIFLDGKTIARSSQDLTKDFPAWKTPVVVDIHPLLTPGGHELVLSAINRTGPPIVLAYSDDLGLFTGPDWQAKDYEHYEWVAALTAESPQLNDIGEGLPSAREGFAATLPVTLPIFVVVFALTLCYHRIVAFAAPLSNPILAHWALMIAWAILCLNNVIKVPYGLGFDVDAHVQYVQFILRNHSIPYADQGWQMFQSPLYYLVLAPIYAVTFEFLGPTHAAAMLRIVSIFCGGIQIHLCFLVVREFFPDKGGVQVLGTLVGGFLPINIYQSQNLGNEPLMALFASAALLRMFYLIRYPERYGRIRSHMITGLLLGAAFLTKFTAVLLLAPAGLAIAIAAVKCRSQRWNQTTFAVGAVTANFGAATLISSWYYIRNYFRFGRFFVGGWDEARGYIWWQEPGYRVSDQFLTFGDALVYPVYSAVHGFWDGLYSTLWLAAFSQPPDAKMASYPGWNYDFVTASAWWSVLPTIVILIGTARILWSPLRSAISGELLAVISVAIFVAAMAYLTLRLPSFSTIKATYLLAVVTCVSILAARGFEPLLKFRLTRALAFAWMSAWAAAVFAAHFA